MANKLLESEKAEIYKQMFDYINNQHLQLITTIEQTRTLCNYVVVTILAFLGLLLQNPNTSQNLLNTDTRRFIMIFALLIIFILYYKIIQTLNVTSGFNAVKAVSVIEDASKELDSKVVQKGLMNNAKSQHDNAENQINKIFKLKEYFLIVTFIYILILLVFISFKSINLHV